MFSQRFKYISVAFKGWFYCIRYFSPESILARGDVGQVCPFQVKRLRVPAGYNIHWLGHWLQLAIVKSVGKKTTN